MHCRVNGASNTSSPHFLQTINSIIRYFWHFFVPHLPIAPKTCKKVVKANLSRLVKPADEGPHNSAWGSRVYIGLLPPFSGPREGCGFPNTTNVVIVLSIVVIITFSKIR